MKNLLQKLTADAEVYGQCLRQVTQAAAVAPAGSSNVHAIYMRDVNGPMPDSESCLNIQGKCGCMHAEQKLITNMFHCVASRSLEQAEQFILLSTLEPCSTCAHLIATSRLFCRVYWLRPYADGLGSRILKGYGIESDQAL